VNFLYDHFGHCAALAVIVLINSACSAQVKLAVTAGAGACLQVEVPAQEWSADPTTGSKNTANVAFQTNALTGLEFRSVPGENKPILFAALPMSNRDVVGPYSKEKYTFGLNPATPIRDASQEEWTSAQTLNHFKRRVAYEGIIGDDDNKNLVYKGKQYSKSGEHLTLAITSSEDRWVAVFSYDGEQRYISPQQRGQGNLAVSAPTKHPKDGKLYVDIYDTATGQKLVSMGGPFHNDIPVNWFLAAYFLEDRHFVFNSGDPQDLLHQFWICELPPASSK
jgi:hypothetical protein